MAARIVSLGGSPSVTLRMLDLPTGAAATLAWLASMQREADDAIVEAIPADADDAEGEAKPREPSHMTDQSMEAHGPRWARLGWHAREHRAGQGARTAAQIVSTSPSIHASSGAAPVRA